MNNKYKVIIFYVKILEVKINKEVFFFKSNFYFYKYLNYKLKICIFLF